MPAAVITAPKEHSTLSGLVGEMCRSSRRLGEITHRVVSRVGLPSAGQTLPLRCGQQGQQLARLASGASSAFPFLPPAHASHPSFSFLRSPEDRVPSQSLRREGKRIWPLPGSPHLSVTGAKTATL